MQMLWNYTIYSPRLVCAQPLYFGSLSSPDCLSSLTTWLAHSKRKVCDVCKHPYSFTKGTMLRLSVLGAGSDLQIVYAPNMPSHLPPLLLVRRLIQQFLFAILFVIRVVVVALMWLAVLPWITVWTWRMYFAMGETTCVACLLRASCAN